MSAPEPEKVLHQLQEAIDRLRVDLARVEIWAGALDAFSRSVPDYDTAAGLDRFRVVPLADEAADSGLAWPAPAVRDGFDLEPTVRDVRNPSRP
jgi:hypothetical protein